jgi:hypothetical protein
MDNMKQLNAQFNNIDLMTEVKPSSTKQNTPRKGRNTLINSIDKSQTENKQPPTPSERPKFEYERLKRIELLRKRLREQRLDLTDMSNMIACLDFNGFHKSFNQLCKEFDLIMTVKISDACKCEIFLDIFRIFSYKSKEKEKCEQIACGAVLSILTGDYVLTYRTITNENNEKIFELFSPEFNFVDNSSNVFESATPTAAIKTTSITESKEKM